MNFSLWQHLACDVLLEFVEFIGNGGIVTEGSLLKRAEEFVSSNISHLLHTQSEG